MNLLDRIEVLAQLGQVIIEELETEFDATIKLAIAENGWFTEASIRKALLSIAVNFLNADILSSWVSVYELNEPKFQRVGLILAGNIPMVGFHDILCVFTSGNVSLCKYSSKDKVLIPYLISRLAGINPGTIKYFEEVDRLNDMDVVIATGGSTAATHFHHYFSKYPHIIRKNRSSVAVITENDDHESLKKLGSDIFDYFGLGCRSVSKLFLPRGFNTDRIFESLVDYGYVIDHNKYKNNYDYSYSIYLLGKQKFLTNNFLIIMEEERLSSRIACIHYEYYDDLDQLVLQLNAQKDNLQCVAAQIPLKSISTVPFGSCQNPKIDDYADGVDTLAFLANL